MRSHFFATGDVRIDQRTTAVAAAVSFRRYQEVEDRNLNGTVPLLRQMVAIKELFYSA